MLISSLNGGPKSIAKMDGGHGRIAPPGPPLTSTHPGNRALP